MGRARLFRALTGVVHRLAAGRPVLFTVDDVHLADPSTIDWLTYATRLTDPNQALLVIATRRAGEGSPPAASAVIRLDPLDRVTVATIVGPDRTGPRRRAVRAQRRQPALLD